MLFTCFGSSSSSQFYDEYSRNKTRANIRFIRLVFVQILTISLPQMNTRRYFDYIYEKFEYRASIFGDKDFILRSEHQASHFKYEHE